MKRAAKRAKEKEAEAEAKAELSVPKLKLNNLYKYILKGLIYKRHKSFLIFFSELLL